MVNNEIISLQMEMKKLEYELINTPMNSQTRLNKVVALDKLNDAINLLESINY